MSAKHKFRGALINLIKHNRDGAKVTQSNRRHGLLKVANDLIKMGIKIEHPRYLRQRHIKRLLELWKGEGISAGTLKNRMAHIRWLCTKLNKANIIPGNDDLAIPKRVYVSNEDKSRVLSEGDLKKIRSEAMRLSLRAQALFGLRVETSLKCQPHLADAEKYFFVKGSWSKGGKSHYIPITSQAQRDWLEEAKQFVLYKGSSLIPEGTSYKTYLSRFQKVCDNAGIHHRHGHRHFYAQQRYKELTGWECPVKGGPSKQELTQAQKQLDRAVRFIVAQEVAHERLQILGVYCGK